MLHLTPDHDDVCCFIATTTAAIIAAIAAAGASTAGSAMAAHGASKGAQTAADATTNAAAIKAKSDADALAFQKQQAEADWRNAETTRKANYDQSLARMDRLGSLYDILGMHRPSMPAYVPTQDPNLSGAPGGAPAAAGGPPGATNGSAMPMSGDPVTDAVAKNYAALGAKPTGPGTGPTDIAYMVQKINETGGLTPDNQKYWLGPQGRIATELAKASGGGSNTGSIAAMRSPVNNPMQATSLAAPALFQAPARVWGTM